MKNVRSSRRPGPGWVKKRQLVRNSRGKRVMQKRWVPPPKPRPKVEITKGAPPHLTYGSKVGPKQRERAGSGLSEGLKVARDYANTCPHCYARNGINCRSRFNGTWEVVTCWGCNKEFVKH